MSVSIPQQWCMLHKALLDSTEPTQSEPWVSLCMPPEMIPELCLLPPDLLGVAGSPSPSEICIRLPGSPRSRDEGKCWQSVADSGCLPHKLASRTNEATCMPFILFLLQNGFLFDDILTSLGSKCPFQGRYKSFSVCYWVLLTCCADVLGSALRTSSE